MVIDWRSLVGLRDNPAELLGYGSIAAADVRAMLSQPNAVLRRLVTDPVTGVLIDYGTTRYRPDAHHAIYCDDEHCTAFPRGNTSAGNVCPLCRKHHRRKTAGRFTYSRPDPVTGKTVWTTPLGFVYVQEPASYDESGPDPGDTLWIDAEADQRWIPPLPPELPGDG